MGTLKEGYSCGALRSSSESLSGLTWTFPWKQKG